MRNFFWALVFFASLASAEVPSLKATAFPVAIPRAEGCWANLGNRFRRNSTRLAEAHKIITHYQKHAILPRPATPGTRHVDRANVLKYFEEYGVTPEENVLLWFAAVLGANADVDVKTVLSIYLSELREFSERAARMRLYLAYPARLPDPDYLRIALSGARWELTAEGTRRWFEETGDLFASYRWNVGRRSGGAAPFLEMGKSARSVAALWALAQRTNLSLENLAEFFAAAEYLHGDAALAINPDVLPELFLSGLEAGLTLPETLQNLAHAHWQLVNRLGFGKHRPLVSREALPYATAHLQAFYFRVVQPGMTLEKLLAEYDKIADALGEDVDEVTLLHLAHLIERYKLSPAAVRTEFFNVSREFGSLPLRIQVLRYRYEQGLSLKDAKARVRDEEIAQMRRDS